MNKSYPTDPGVARCGLIAFSDNLWKYVSSMGCWWGFPDWVQSRAPVIQKSLPVPSCPGVWRICGPVEGPERRPSRFCHLHWVDFGCMGFGHVLDSLCRGVVRGDVTGQVRLCILENRRRQPEKGLSVIFLIVPVARLKVFLIRYT